MKVEYIGTYAATDEVDHRALETHFVDGDLALLNLEVQITFAKDRKTGKADSSENPFLVENREEWELP